MITIMEERDVEVDDVSVLEWSRIRDTCTETRSGSGRSNLPRIREKQTHRDKLLR